LILDTSFLVDVQNGFEAATEKAAEIESDGRPRRVPHTVLYELYIGVGKGVQTDENRERVENVLSSLPLEPTTPSIARRAGKLEGELKKDGEAIGAVDALVASTALDYDEPVVTADTEDFERVPDLRTETY
jgi:predicted nucleic acid-binding protein